MRVWLERIAIIALVGFGLQIYSHHEVIREWFDAQLIAADGRYEPQAETGLVTGQASVIDGDTLEIHGIRIRLHGIDAPESDQLCQKDGQSYRCGQVAALALADLIGRRTVRCQTREKDRYGRFIARCYVESTDLGRWMVREGHALAYRRYSTDYVGDEDQARGARRGMWAGTFQNPWEYRQGKR